MAAAALRQWLNIYVVLPRTADDQSLIKPEKEGEKSVNRRERGGEGEEEGKGERQGEGEMERGER